MSQTTPTIYWGTGNLASFTGTSPAAAGSPEAVLEALELLKSHGLTYLDTAQRYGNGKAEDVLGQALALFSNQNTNSSPSDFKFTIDTKWAVPTDTALSPDTILPSAQQSSTYLTSTSSSQTPINTLYLHSPPHADSSLGSILSAIDKAHKSHLFTHFGVSNFSPALVAETHALCTRHNYILPTVYQGMYNAVHRAPETDLFPLLRSLDMRFVCYSPIAGGFLTKTRDQLEDPQTSSGGRFSASLAGTEAAKYRDTYVTDAMLAALQRWGAIAEREGLERAELAYRWVVFHSALDGSKGDGVVLGARGVGQLEETVKWIEKGALSEKAVGGVQEIWDQLVG